MTTFATSNRRSLLLLGVLLLGLAGGSALVDSWTPLYSDQGWVRATYTVSRTSEQLAPAVLPTDSGGWEVQLSRADLLFAVGSTGLDEDSFAELEQVLLSFRGLRGARIKIIGHADATGSVSRNQALSEERADAAKRYFVGHRVPESVIEAVGVGATAPSASNSTAEGRKANRHVSIWLVPDEVLPMFFRWEQVVVIMTRGMVALQASVFGQVLSLIATVLTLLGVLGYSRWWTETPEQRRERLKVVPGQAA